jgi:hypothetical protein
MRKDQQTNAKHAPRNMPEDCPELEVADLDYLIHAGGAVSVDEATMDLDFTITPALTD